MRFRLKGLAGLFVLFSSVSFARGYYSECRISGGSKFSCGGWFTGKAVVKDGGDYLKCNVSNGWGNCQGWYTGQAVVKDRGDYHLCKIEDGEKISCDNAYSGKAVLKENGQFHLYTIENGYKHSCSRDGYSGEAVSDDE